MKEKNEMLYTIPLRDVYEKKRKKRAPSAVKIIKEFLSKHMGVDNKGIKLSTKLNSTIWLRGIEKPPRKIRIKAVKEKETGILYAMLDAEKIEMLLKKEKPKEKKDDKKEQKKAPAENEAKPKGPEKKETPKATAEPKQAIEENK